MLRSTLFSSAAIALGLAAFGNATVTAQTASLAVASAPAEMMKASMMHDHAMSATIEAAAAPAAIKPAVALRVVKQLRLQPGAYEFDVTNVSVDGEAGFVIQRINPRGADTRATTLRDGATRELIARGQTSRTGAVTLKRGRYVISRTMESTPYYVITVR